MMTGCTMRNCAIGIHADAVCPPFADGYAVTRFPDGTESPARPHLNASYRGYAERAGYGTGPGAVTGYCIEHEIAHCFVAEWRGSPYSTVVHADAHGIALPRGVIPEEEGVTRAFQRYFNMGVVSSRLALLIDAGVDMPAMCGAWATLIVRTFGRLRWWEGMLLNEARIAQEAAGGGAR